MFGYTEHDHTVISTQTIVRGGKEAQLDVRRPKPENSDYWTNLLADPTLSARKREEWQRQVEGYNRMPDYLVLVRDGNPTYLLYESTMLGGKGRVSKEEAMVHLQEDLERLVAEPNLDLKTLQWSELVQNDTGYGRDGSICMY